MSALINIYFLKHPIQNADVIHRNRAMHILSAKIQEYAKPIKQKACFLYVFRLFLEKRFQTRCKDDTVVMIQGARES